MVTDIAFNPLLPLVVLIALAAFASLLLALAIWRRLSGWWLRAFAALVLLLALANPSFRQEDRTPLANIVLLVIDQSTSQQIAARPKQIKTALASLKAKLGKLKNIEVKTVIVRDAPKGSDAGTLLMTALSNASAEVARDRIAGAILVTDGQFHDMALAPDLPAPVQVLLSGTGGW